MVTLGRLPLPPILPLLYWANMTLDGASAGRSSWEPSAPAPASASPASGAGSSQSRRRLASTPRTFAFSPSSPTMASAPPDAPEAVRWLDAALENSEFGPSMWLVELTRMTFLPNDLRST